MGILVQETDKTELGSADAFFFFGKYGICTSPGICMYLGQAISRQTAWSSVPPIPIVHRV